MTTEALKKERIREIRKCFVSKRFKNSGAWIVVGDCCNLLVFAAIF